MWRRSPRLLTSLLLASSCLWPLVSCQPSLAVSNTDYAVFPTGQQDSTTPWYTYQLGGGQTAHDSITITNKSDSSASFSMYPVDAVIGDQRAFTMLPAASPRQDVGAWLALGATQLTLPAHTSRQVAVSLNVPRTAAVGPHYGGIIVQPLATTPASGNVMIVSRLGVRVYETVPGHQQPALRITDLSQHQLGNELTVTAILHNDGNTVLSPQGTLLVRDTFGKVVSKVAVSNALITTGAVSKLQAKIVLPRHIPGHFTTTLQLQYATDKNTSQRVGFWYNGRLVVLFGLIEIGIIYVLWRAFMGSPKVRKS